MWKKNIADGFLLTAIWLRFRACSIKKRSLSPNARKTARKGNREAFSEPKRKKTAAKGNRGRISKPI